MCSLVLITWEVASTKHDKNQCKGWIEKEKVAVVFLYLTTLTTMGICNVMGCG
jgi:hypothetical protein